MSTRSNIAVKVKRPELNGGYAYKQIYVHFDGDVSALGRTLYEDYNTQEKVEELVNMGDASAIGSTLADCIFYCRDRGEELHFEGLDTPQRDNQYLYIFKDGGWKVISSYKNGPLENFF